jgi:hypothetical protein
MKDKEPEEEKKGKPAAGKVSRLIPVLGSLDLAEWG